MQLPPQALRFSHGRGERETRVTGLGTRQTGMNNVLRMSVTSLVYQAITKQVQASIARSRSTRAKSNSCIWGYVRSSVKLIFVNANEIRIR